MKTFTAERDSRGNPVARCHCSGCEAEIVVRCDHRTKSRSSLSPKVEEAQAIVKLNAEGWTFIGSVLRCPTCEIKRREAKMAKEPTVFNITPPAVAPLRQPTRDQKRLIVSMLEEAYDIEKQRYKGTETDKGIADFIGDGIMPGWVSAIREDMFGPDGNEEMTDLSAEVADWIKKADIALANANQAISEFVAARAKVKEIGQRLDKVIAAIGPKAEKI